MGNDHSPGRLDRAGDRRKDPDWIEAQLKDQSSRFVVLWRDQQLLIGNDGNFRAALLERDALRGIPIDPSEAVFLGLDHEAASTFALDLTALEDPLAQIEASGSFAENFSFQGLMTTAQHLDDREAALLTFARGMANWHRRHRFCGVCGAPASAAEGGHVRVCTNAACGSQHFPRTDPAVIMLVTDGDRCLLGRQKAWPKQFHSVLAGFVEPGESLEHAVAREVWEEAGIQVDRVTYYGSQPWPFPASVMLGFRAHAVTTDINVDTVELESAEWYSRDWLRSLPDDGEFVFPRRAPIAGRMISIAGCMVEDWLDGRFE